MGNGSAWRISSYCVYGQWGIPGLACNEKSILNSQYGSYSWCEDMDYWCTDVTEGRLSKSGHMMQATIDNCDLGHVTPKQHLIIDSPVVVLVLLYSHGQGKRSSSSSSHRTRQVADDTISPAQANNRYTLRTRQKHPISFINRYIRRPLDIKCAQTKATKQDVRDM